MTCEHCGSRNAMAINWYGEPYCLFCGFVRIEVPAWLTAEIATRTGQGHSGKREPVYRKIKL